MTTQRVETMLTPTLRELARGPYPDYIDDVLSLTARTRQRPAWASPTRWLPISDRLSGLWPAGRVAWRAFILAAVLMALVVAGAVVLVGSQPRLPAPFGPAANGLIVYESVGDIHVADMTTGVARSIISGPDADAGTRFSLDGAHVAFERRADGGSHILVARHDASDVRQLTPRPIRLGAPDVGRSWERYEFSPDGASLLINTLDDRGGGTLTVAATDGSGIRVLDVGMAANESSFRPPDGREILFIGRRGDVGLYAVDSATGRVRTILVVPPGADLAGASWSPDGSRIAYWSWDTNVTGLTARTRVVRADGTDDRALPMPSAAVWNAHATWSNDGTMLFIARGHTPGFDDVRGVVLPADGTSVGIEVASDGSVETVCCAAWFWSPDDRYLLGRPGPGSLARPVLIDVAARQSRPVLFDVTGDVTWQRVRP